MTHRLILAPLMGITGAVFRQVFSRHFTGFSAALAPFITTTHGNPASRSHFKDLWPENNKNSLAVIPQLIGRDGPDFARAANRLHHEWGFAEVNWNIGCPSGTVTAKKRGAGLLPFPDLIDAFLDHVCKAITCSLQVKMRVGMHDPYEFRGLVPVLNRYPLSEITVHPRTGDQQYNGTVNREAFAEFYSLCKKPVVYNGDITSAAGARELCAAFGGLSGLMIGRGAIANPFLARAIQSGDDEKKLLDRAKIKNFHDDLFQTYAATLEGGPPVVLGRMKELWAYWKPVASDPKAIKAVLKAKKIDDYLAAAGKALL